MKILIIGESCKDIFHYGDCSRLCPDAPVPVFKLIKTQENWGMAKNVERNLHSLGANITVVTNDKCERIRKIRYMDNRTNHMFLRVDENDQDYGVLERDRIESIDYSLYDAVVVSDYNKGFLTPELLQYISKLHPVTFIDTKRVLGEWANNFSFIKLNSKEYELTEHTVTKDISRKLIVTRGPAGSEYHGKTFEVPTVEVKDTSGAGDTFIAGLCYKFVKTNDIFEAIKYANGCATRVVQRRGVSVI
jgi:bifunctional ADP-heptose synthase (sugar kinase/adenylyltransferase)